LWLTGWLGPEFGRRAAPFRVIGPTGTKALMENIEKAFAADVKIRLEDEKLPSAGIAIAPEEYGTASDLLIHEVGSARKELMVNLFAQRIIAHHTTPSEAGQVFTRAKPKLAVYTHIVLLSSATISEPTLDEVVAETRQIYDGPLEVGEDLMAFEIGDTVTVRKP
jgi:ribonuclease Z